MYDAFYVQCARYRTWISSYYKRLHTRSAGHANAVVGAVETVEKKIWKLWSAAERYRRKTVGFVSADKRTRIKTFRIYRNFVSWRFHVYVSKYNILYEYIVWCFSGRIVYEIIYKSLCMFAGAKSAFRVHRLMRLTREEFIVS